MWLSLKALDWSAKWYLHSLELKEMNNRAAGDQCSQGLQSCQQNIPAVTEKPNSTLTSWHSRGDFISDGWSWDFRLQSMTLWCLKNIWAGSDSFRLIHLWMPTLKGWKQNPLLAGIILVWTWSGSSDTTVIGIKQMRLWSDPHSFSRGTTCITMVMRKWHPSP